MDNKEIKNETKVTELKENYIDSIVKTLKSEANELNKNLIKYRQNKDMNLYISTLKSLRETMNLIHEYDWQPQSSKYKVDDKTDSESHYEFATWEQNSDNEIRNHKRYKLASPEDLNKTERHGVSYVNGKEHVMTNEEMDQFEDKFNKEMKSMSDMFNASMKSFDEMNKYMQKIFEFPSFGGFKMFDR